MRIRIVLVLFAFATLAGRLPAQEEPPESEPIIVVEEEGDAAADDNDEGESSGAAEARRAADEDRFIPSREVPPDEQVIFPIDI